MENRFKNKCKELQAAQESLLQTCLKTITRIVRQYPDATLSFGNTTLKVEDDVVKIAVGWRRERLLFVPLYGEDGFESLDDIANWADIVTDVHNCYWYGNKEYAANWNTGFYYRVLVYDNASGGDEDFTNAGNDFFDALDEWKEMKAKYADDTEHSVFLYIMKEDFSDNGVDEFVDDITYDAEEVEKETAEA